MLNPTLLNDTNRKEYVALKWVHGEPLTVDEWQTWLSLMNKGLPALASVDQQTMIALMDQFVGGMSALITKLKSQQG